MYVLLPVTQHPSAVQYSQLRLKQLIHYQVRSEVECYHLTNQHNDSFHV